ncbi:MAG: bifunctional nuclease domain-containing protein [Bacteroidota bacterium]
MKKIPMDIVALSHSVAASHNYAVVLGEKKGARRLPIVIGGFEAQAIAVAMERMTPSRPLTHDLMRNVLDTFQIELKEVVINNLIDGIFYSVLVCEKNGKIEEIDSRTSDALALAVRFDCPIYTYEFILDKAGVVMENENELDEDEELYSLQTEDDEEGNNLKDYTLTQLNDMLEEVLEKEDYKFAAKIRDEINLRKGEL